MGGAIRYQGGSPEQQSKISRALRVDPERTRAHVHGFHSYPARLHPLTAAALIEAYSLRNGWILDPFCGSGTTLVEARRLGRRAIGSDLNPLALELSWLKTSAFGRAFTQRLYADAAAISAFADERRRSKAGPFRRYPRSTRDSFPVHVLLELDGLLHGIRAIEGGPRQRALILVLSSLLTKVSTRKSDSSEQRLERRLRSGFTIQLFQEKARELCRRLDRYQRLLPKDTHAPRLHHADARRLTMIESGSVDLVVSSPPYPGVFDYLEHHRMRLSFVSLDAEQLDRGEIGARRKYSRLCFEDALARWYSELAPCLAEIARILRPNGHAALVLADTAVGGRALRADRLLTEWVARTPLRIVLCASQARPSFHHPSDRVFREHERAEHLLLLQK